MATSTHNLHHRHHHHDGPVGGQRGAVARPYVNGSGSDHGDGPVTHDQVVAAVIGAALVVLSAVSGVAGVLAAEVSTTVLATGAVFAAGTLLSVLGWMAVTLYQINGTTAATNEIVHGAVSDVARIEQRLDEHQAAIARLQGRPPVPPAP